MAIKVKAKETQLKLNGNCPHLTMREAGIIVRVGVNKVGY